MSSETRSALACTLAVSRLTDQSVLVPDSELFKLRLVLGLEDFLEDILESTVILLQDGVLGRHVKRHLLGDGHLETRVRETGDRFIGVVHGHGDTLSLEVVDVHDDGLTATFRLVHKLELSGTRSDEIRRSVLISERVSTNDDGLGPSWDGLGDSLEHDRFTEDGTAEDVSDGSVGGSPHLLELEFFNSSWRGVRGGRDGKFWRLTFIWGDGRALDTDVVLLDGFGGINGDLVVRLLTSQSRSTTTTEILT